jgi:hypothetical protein
MVNSRSEALTAVCIKIMTLLDVRPCNLIDIHQHFDSSPVGVIFYDVFTASDGKMNWIEFVKKWWWPNLDPIS